MSHKVADLSPVERELYFQALEEKHRRKEIWDKFCQNTELYKYEPRVPEFHSTLKNRVVIVGGNQLGKSEAGCAEVAIQATGIIPKSLKNVYPVEKINQEGVFWVCCVTLGVLEGTIIPKFMKYIPKHLVVKYPRPPRYTMVLKKLDNSTGAKISFKAYEQGRAKFQAETITGCVWMDEEPENQNDAESIYNEICERVKVHKRPIYITYTPLLGETWIQRRLVKDKLKPVDQQDPNIEVIPLTVRTLKFTDLQIAELRKQYPTEEEFRTRCFGEVTQVYGRPVFDRPAVRALFDKAKDGVCGNVVRSGDKYHFLESQDGYLRVFKFPEPGKFYVLGVDVSEGLKQGDFSAIQILDRDTAEQVAVWHGHSAYDELDSIVAAVGHFYNYAFIGVEADKYGLSVVQNLFNRQKYFRLYKKEIIDEITNKPTTKLGWYTNKTTKPVMINELAMRIKDEKDKLVLYDKGTIEEMSSFVFDDAGKMGAMIGCFDDRVMSLAIALQMTTRTPKVKRQEGRINYIKRPLSHKYTGYR